MVRLQTRPVLSFELYPLSPQPRRMKVPVHLCDLHFNGSGKAFEAIAESACVVLSSTSSFSLALRSSRLAFFSALRFALFTSTLSSSSASASSAFPLSSTDLLVSTSLGCTATLVSAGFVSFAATEETTEALSSAAIADGSLFFG